MVSRRLPNNRPMKEQRAAGMQRSVGYPAVEIALILWRLMSRGTRCAVVAAGALSIGAAAALSFQPYVVGFAIERAINSNTYAEAALLIALGGMAYGVLMGGTHLFTLYSRESIAVDTACRFMSSKLAELVEERHGRRTAVEFVHAYSKVGAAAHALVADFLGIIVPTIVGLTLAIALVLYTFPRSVALVVCSVVFLGLTLSFVFGRIEKRAARALMESDAKLSVGLGRSSDLHEALNAYNATKPFERVFTGHCASHLAAAKSASGIFFSKNVVLELLQWGGIAIAFIVASSTGALSAPSIATLLLVFLQVFQPLGQLVRASERIVKSWTEFGVFIPHTTLRRALRDACVPEIDEIRGIEFRCFQCEFDEGVVDISTRFKVDKGMAVLLKGRSGVGKSTLAKTLAGLRTCRPSQIFINGVDLSLFDGSKLRERVLYVPQEPHLFDGGIIENVVFYDDLPTRAATDALTALGMGMRANDQIGDRGGSLSGGEKQRIALSRAIMRRRDVVILDEPVASLDDRSKRAVIGLFKQQFRDVILIVISHDSSIEALFDLVVSLEERHGAQATHSAYSQIAA